MEIVFRAAAAIPLSPLVHPGEEMGEAQGFPEFDGIDVFYGHQQLDLSNLSFREERQCVIDEHAAHSLPPVVLLHIEISDKTEFLQLEVFRFMRYVGIAESHDLAIDFSNRKPAAGILDLLNHFF